MIMVLCCPRMARAANSHHIHTLAVQRLFVCILGKKEKRKSCRVGRSKGQEEAPLLSTYSFFVHTVEEEEKKKKSLG